jgi:hypothetical protein
MIPPSLPPTPRLSAIHILGLLAVGPLLGSAFGAMTNLVNGLISPQFFADVMNIRDDLWLNSVRNGIIRGAMFGAVYGTVFVLLLAWISRPRCEPAVALRYVALTILFALALWILGGLLATLYVSLTGALADPFWLGKHASQSSRLLYAWVRGSIFAVEACGIVSVLLSIGCYLFFRSRARRPERNFDS